MRWKEYGLTYATEFTVLFSTLGCYWLVGARLGAEEFAAYALSRRLVSFLQPVLVGGFALALCREVNRSGAERLRGLLLSAAVIFGGVNAVVLVTALVAGGTVERLLFGEPARHLIVPLSASVCGTVTLVLAHEYYRGLRRVAVANGLQAVILGLLPLAVAVFAGNTAAVLAWTGWLQCAVSAVAVVPGFWRGSTPLRLEGMKQLLSYGSLRIPGSIAYYGLLTLPAVVATHLTDLRTGGAIAFGGTLLTLGGVGVVPLTAFLLPRTSQRISEGRIAEIRAELQVLLLVCGVLAGAMLAAVWLIPLWAVRPVRDVSEADIMVIRLMMLGLPSYLVYLVLRHFLDAVHVRPTNGLNSLGGLAGFAVTAAAVYPAAGAVWASALGFAAGLTVLGVLTWWAAARALDELESTRQSPSLDVEAVT